MKIGSKVLVCAGAWQGESGAFAGKEKTTVGELYRIELDNGMASLVSIGDFVVVSCPRGFPHDENCFICRRKDNTE